MAEEVRPLSVRLLLSVVSFLTERIGTPHTYEYT